MHKAEDFHPVPAIRRSREHAHSIGGAHKGASSNTNPNGQDLANEHGPVNKTEVERDLATGKHLVKAHHADGHVATHHHASAGEAHDHARELMSGGDSMLSNGQPGDRSEQDAEMASAGGAEAGEGGAENECPHCGAQMKGGKCPQCGYEAEGEAA